VVSWRKVMIYGIKDSQIKLEQLIYANVLTPLNFCDKIGAN